MQPPPLTSISREHKVKPALKPPDPVRNSIRGFETLLRAPVSPQRCAAAADSSLHETGVTVASASTPPSSPTSAAVGSTRDEMAPLLGETASVRAGLVENCDSADAETAATAHVDAATEEGVPPPPPLRPYEQRFRETVTRCANDSSQHLFQLAVFHSSPHNHMQTHL